MLSGLRFEKADTSKKSKKEKKKEHRKEAKKNKKNKKDGKKDKCEKTVVGSSAGSASSASDEKEPPVDKVKEAKAAVVKLVQEAKAAVATEEPTREGQEFFSSLGKVVVDEKKNKPDPDKLKISEREYNPMLRGEKSNLAAPTSVSSIPKDLCVGDGGSSWRQRMQRRKTQAAREAEPAQTNDAPASKAASSRSSAPPASLGTRGRGDGWRAPAGRASPSPHKGRASPSPHKGRGDERRKAQRSRSRSRSDRKPQRHASRSRSRSRSAGRRDTTSRRVATARQERDKEQNDVEDVLARMQAKYASSNEAASAAKASPAPDPPAESKVAEQDLDGAALAALALEAMLAGDMARYEELNKQVETKQAASSAAAAAEASAGGGSLSSSAVAGNEQRGPKGERIKVLEEVDASGRSVKLMESLTAGASVRTKGKNKRGTANAVPGKGEEVTGYYEDDNISLEDLVRRERIEGVQDYSKNLEHHILKKGSKFKMLHEDEDEAYALGDYERSDRKMEDAKRMAKSAQHQKNDTNRIQSNMEKCTRCPGSKRFGRLDAMVSSAQHTYVCVDGYNQCILPGQVCISPKEHVCAATELDEEVWTEIRNYQKCLVRFFEAEDPPRAVLFVESSVHRVSRDQALLGGGPHCAIMAYPIELGLLQEARLFWKKALDEAEDEFSTQHKKVIDTTAKGGVRGTIPKNFPYVHVDFSLTGGYAHIVDDVPEFPKNFMQECVAGMCELTTLDRAYTNKEQYKNACMDIKKRFAAGFDWAAALKQ